MELQAVLPIATFAPPPGRPDLEAEALHRRDDVEYKPLGVRKILNRATSGRASGWTINPYRGCEFGCTYCYARYTHSFLNLTRWQDFERRIFVKQGAAASLRRALRKDSLAGQGIAIGTVTDPYQPAERHFGVTRSLLEVFREAEGLEISISTKSPLILRDLELLVELDQRHSITVGVTLTTLDPRLARKLEPKAPTPEARLGVVEALADEGIATMVFCMPVMPGINDRERVLRPLIEGAKDAGALDVIGSPLFLRSAARDRFLPWLEEEFPQLTERYRRLYGNRGYLSNRQREKLLAVFDCLRLQYGFPVARPGRA